MKLHNTILVSFSRKQNLGIRKTLNILGEEMKVTSYTKHLGVVMHLRLQWNRYLNKIIQSSILKVSENNLKNEEADS